MYWEKCVSLVYFKIYKYYEIPRKSDFKLFYHRLLIAQSYWTKKGG